jgi:osmotically-inducible protein OsmY
MRAAIRLILVLIVVLAGGFVLFGYWADHSGSTAPASSRPIATSGTVDTEKARERGAEIGGKAAEVSAKAKQSAEVAATKLKETVEEASITSKIKAKMALDDSVKALAIDVSTTGSTVTLSGRVRSAAEHNRALALTRETNGVTHVVDRLVVQQE